MASFLLQLAVVAVAIAATAVAAPKGDAPPAYRPWMRVGDTPEQRAAALLKQMTLEEKIVMLHGTKGHYVGNVAPNDRLGIPPLNLNDGPQGFRSGGSTCWPSAMTVATTWDTDLALQWGKSMGAEFFGKGSNVQLGPGLCLARVPVNGRNFEYMSGEDPMLGYHMVQPVVTGIQSSGVIANAKHYIMNNQETQRNSIDELVDERTRFELYYPPFLGALEADVGSIMCSYNKINGFWSCENNETLARDYKQRLGFRGWVMSDWGATHSMSINAGLDQEMPGSNSMNEANLKAALAAGTVTQAKIDDSVTRMLVPMFKYNIFENHAQWANASKHDDDVTSPAHSLLARYLASNATVMLKNSGSLLPLDVNTVKSIALIGDQAVHPIVNGGGSGSVGPTYVISPQQGIQERANGERTPNCTYFNDTDFYHQGDHSVHATSPEECCKQCSLDMLCVAFTFQTPSSCWIHTVAGEKRQTSGLTSGTCVTTPGLFNVTYNDGSDPAQAAAAAAAADVAIVFVATSSHEGADRANLSFPAAQNAMVDAVGKAQAKTVVAMVTPGASLLPWESDVASILCMFMPGLEMGHALADVLFGDANPSGRLPLTFPNKENEVGFTPDMYPGVNGASNYTERLLVGYRWYDEKQVVPKFPFGHGLSYTTFGYSDLAVSGKTVTAKITNTGKVAGAEVVQLYIGYPSSAGEPPQVLRYFQKMRLEAGGSAAVSFTLTSRDLSIWDVGTHNWAEVHGDFGLFLGSSSRDIRLKGSLTN